MKAYRNYVRIVKLLAILWTLVGGRSLTLLMTEIPKSILALVLDVGARDPDKEGQPIEPNFGRQLVHQQLITTSLMTATSTNSQQGTLLLINPNSDNLSIPTNCRLVNPSLGNLRQQINMENTRVNTVVPSLPTSNKFKILEKKNVVNLQDDMPELEDGSTYLQESQSHALMSTSNNPPTNTLIFPTSLEPLHKPTCDDRPEVMKDISIGKHPLIRVDSSVTAAVEARLKGLPSSHRNPPSREASLAKNVTKLQDSSKNTFHNCL